MYDWWLEPSRFPGNQWDKPLGEDELWLLWYPLREIAYAWDFVSNYTVQKIELYQTIGWVAVDVHYR